MISVHTLHSLLDQTHSKCSKEGSDRLEECAKPTTSEQPSGLHIVGFDNNTSFRQVTESRVKPKYFTAGVAISTPRSQDISVLRPPLKPYYLASRYWQYKKIRAIIVYKSDGLCKRLPAKKSSCFYNEFEQSSYFDWSSLYSVFFKWHQTYRSWNYSNDIAFQRNIANRASETNTVYHCCDN